MGIKPVELAHAKKTAYVENVMTMLLLFPIVLLSYAAMHVYMGIKLCLAFPFLKPWTALLVIAATGLFAGPFLARMFGNRGHVFLARLAGAVGYTWIAVVFWFFALGLLVDAWNLLLRVGSLLAPAVTRGHIPAGPAVLSAAWIIGLALLWGTIEANGLHVERLVLKSDRLPKGRTIRLAQISDLHMSVNGGERMLRRVVRALEDLNPDLIVSTGDLIDSPFRELRAAAESLRNLLPAVNRYAVLGNHEYYTGLNEAFAFHEEAGFTLLRGDLIEAAPGLWLAGVDDPAGSYTRQPHFEDERALASRSADGFVVLLKHQPLVSREAGAWFDLQLSGHTHGGQIFPFEWFLKPIYPWRRGLHELARDRRLYVNRGAGTWGPPMRLFARPEITLIVLEGRASPR